MFIFYIQTNNSIYSSKCFYPQKVKLNNKSTDTKQLRLQDKKFSSDPINKLKTLQSREKILTADKLNYSPSHAFTYSK